MRGLARGLWLAAALLVDVAKGDRVQFTGGFSGGEYPPGRPREDDQRSGVFNATANTPKVFSWTADNLKIDKVILNVHDGRIDKSRPIGTWFLSTGLSKLPIQGKETEAATERRSANQKRQPVDDQNPGPGGMNSPITLEVTSDPHGSNVTIPDLSQVNHGPNALYFEVVWSSLDPSTGRSYSPAFAVMTVDDNVSLTASSANDKFFKNEPFQPFQPNLTTGNDDTNGGMGTTEPKSTSTATSASTASPSSGLPIGAIAGIAAACGILGLLLVAFLVWYFLRKRQRQRDSLAIQPYGATGRTRTDELMAEKEANLVGSGAGGAGGGAPSSPYSDAGGLEERQQPRAIAAAGHRSSLSGGGGAATPLIPPLGPALPVGEAVAGDGPPSYTPYTDRPTAAAAAGTGEAVVPVEEGRATPHGVSTQYAHLVEEGMTAEEIRRLEEEERALDAAIEQAVRRPTG